VGTSADAKSIITLLTHTRLKIDNLNRCRLASSLVIQKPDLKFVIDNPLIVVLCAAVHLKILQKVMPWPWFKPARRSAIAVPGLGAAQAGPTLFSSVRWEGSLGQFWAR
jgi:hypothetical protein